MSDIAGGGYILEMLGISKSFPGVKALDKVDLRLRKGEVHGLAGENGAGKSTLMKVLSGLYSADEGELRVDGERKIFRTPQDSMAAGIAIIYQELNLVSKLDAIQNVMLGHEKAWRGWLDKKAEEAEARKWLDYVSRGTLPDYRLPVGRYSVAQQQMVEIAKALSLHARIMVMDEPTDSLTDKELVILMGIIGQLKADGIAVVYISHRLEEIFELCDNVTVLRDGRLVDSMPTADIDRFGLIKLMIGRELSNTFPPRHRAATGETVLEARGLCSGRFKDVTFELKKGEILGFAGLVGSGRTEVMRAIFGADGLESGSVIYKGKAVDFRHPHASVRAGIGFATEDRKEQGLFLGLSIKSNVSIASLKRLSRCGFLRFRKERDLVDEYIAELKVATTDSAKQCKNLSGGNQQKVVLAKWLAIGSSVLILDEPTRGIDVGAKYEIYALMDELVQKGMSIIMVSSELPEVIAMSDRIVVMHEGCVVGTIGHEEADENLVMTYASGMGKACSA